MLHDPLFDAFVHLFNRFVYRDSFFSRTRLDSISSFLNITFGLGFFAHIHSLLF
ncbi:hypothetical protein HBHAL_1671 [Halobacillus halophilus DSM 2266]|uniref:Uncharacterized protein n=1 Tax=Halobacillus halophilus (strain ATCC 35676 / DSM 2266 / JCM 20832 / KCTC 3685 / LMG 17431 / NBRC 102448 / NCIMB 2269) TaxID=866895 RepID=I0JIS0_HALH3|nr:hypothetical protein HBHAL_1671 [Halobacillus halophilus DSM 2266]